MNMENETGEYMNMENENDYEYETGEWICKNDHDEYFYPGISIFVKCMILNVCYYVRLLRNPPFPM